MRVVLHAIRRCRKLLPRMRAGCGYWFVVRVEFGGTDVCSSTGATCFVNQCLCHAASSWDASDVTVLPDSDTRFYDPHVTNAWLPHAAYAQVGWLQQYCFALFWAVQVTTSIGGNVVPFTPLETGFTVCMILIGLVMYSVVIGAASAALSSMDSATAAQRRVRDGVLAYMRARKVPRFFQRIVADYYSHTWSTQVGTSLLACVHATSCIAVTITC